MTEDEMVKWHHRCDGHEFEIICIPKRHFGVASLVSLQYNPQSSIRFHQLCIFFHSKIG